MNLDDLSDFLLVAKHQGFAQASRVSGIPKASLSRRVMDLETALGVRLFERSSRLIRLTEEGEMLLKRTGGLISEINEVASELREGRTHPHGLLRISTPMLFGQIMMGQLAAKFALAYPEVKLAITLEDRQVDLVADGYDLVIRINPEPTAELFGRCFAKSRILIVSTPEFKDQFAQSGKKKTAPLPAIAHSTSTPNSNWKMADDTVITTQTMLQLPLLTMMRDAALTGLGLARLPGIVVANDLVSGRLVSWGETDKASELWVLHTSKRLPSEKTKAFMDFLKITFKNGNI